MTIKQNDDLPVALLDMDGTVADYDGQLAKDMNRLASPSEPPFQVWPRGEQPDYITARMDLIKCRGEWWENLPVLPLGMKIVDALRDRGFEIHILTQGPRSNPAAWSHKAKWVMKNLPDVRMTITRDKGLVYGRMLVDDWPEYVERWLKWRPRGMVVMPAQPWNADYKHPNVLRYDGTDDEGLYATMERAYNR